MARRRRAPRPGALADLAPLRILTQIALLQLSYYGVALVLIVFTTFVAGQHPNAGVFLDWHNLRSDVTTGWTLGLCWMLDSLITVIPILLLIARSKLVLDFALTIHFINLLVTTLYTRAIPDTLYWWLVQICSAALMTSLGMWACQWRELQPMMFGGNAAKASPGDAGDGPEGSRLMGDGETAAMGDTEERGRDGTVSYEMSGITPKEAASRNVARSDDKAEQSDLMDLMQFVVNSSSVKVRPDRSNS
nr:protein sys1 [Quercus suber]